MGFEFPKPKPATRPGEMPADLRINTQPKDGALDVDPDHAIPPDLADIREFNVAKEERDPREAVVRELLGLQTRYMDIADEDDAPATMASSDLAAHGIGTGAVMEADPRPEDVSPAQTSGQVPIEFSTVVRGKMKAPPNRPSIIGSDEDDLRHAA